MKAYILEQAGGTENMKLTEVDKPSIKANEVLVSVKAISVNPVDYKVRAIEPVLNAIYGEKRPAILGWDIAGTVAEAGGDVSNFTQNLLPHQKIISRKSLKESLLKRQQQVP